MNRSAAQEQVKFWSDDKHKNNKLALMLGAVGYVWIIAAVILLAQDEVVLSWIWLGIGFVFIFGSTVIANRARESAESEFYWRGYKDAIEDSSRE